VVKGSAASKTYMLCVRNVCIDMVLMVQLIMQFRISSVCHAFRRMSSEVECSWAKVHGLARKTHQSKFVSKPIYPVVSNRSLNPSHEFVLFLKVPIWFVYMLQSCGLKDY